MLSLKHLIYSNFINKFYRVKIDHKFKKINPKRTITIKGSVFKNVLEDVVPRTKKSNI